MSTTAVRRPVYASAQEEVVDNVPRATSGSVGIVELRFLDVNEPLHLLAGGVLPQYTIAYETYGALNADRTNAILIFHALSGDAHVAGYYTDDPAERPGWWDAAVGPGKMFDTDRFYVICSNVLGGCRGTTGPRSLAPNGKPYGSRFPAVTVADMVAVQAKLLDALGIHRLFAVAGGSMGAMQALQFSVDFPDRVEHVLFIASTPRSNAQNIAFNEIGRQAIYADPRWCGGDYPDSNPPVSGLAIARMVGHMTYMSEHSLETKFGRRLQGQSSLPYRTDIPEFAVESYLQHQGEKFTQRFDAGSYVLITKALDYFDISDGFPSMSASLQRAAAQFLVISFSSDWLYTAAQSRLLAQALREAGREVEIQEVTAALGHDSFLVEVETMTALVGGYLNRMWEALHSPLAQ